MASAGRCWDGRGPHRVLCMPCTPPASPVPYPAWPAGSTTNATAPSRPRCTAWCSSMRPASSRTPRPALDAELPRFIKDEFDAFLECGILAHGFPRLRCGECGHDKLPAFSCKRRGILPFVRRPAHVADRCASGRSRHPARPGAAVGAVAPDPAAGAAGRAAGAGHAGAAGGAARGRASSAAAGCRADV
jgi:hypothetical protein